MEVWRTAAAVTVVLAAVGAALVWNTQRSQAALMRVDPDATVGAARQYAVAHGRGVFADRCAACHGRDGRGGLGPNLTDRDWLYGTGRAGDIEQVVAYGIRSYGPRSFDQADMPAYASARPYARYPIPSLKPPEIADVVAYLAYLRKGAPTPAAVRGGAIFQNRGGCYDCHGTDGRGDPAIGTPNLTDNIWLHGDGSDAAIYQTIAQGSAGRMPAFAGRLSDVRIREVALYVQSLSAQTAEAGEK